MYVRHMRTVCLGLVIAAACLLALFVADKLLPYSLDDMRRIKALGLVHAVRAYTSQGDTNLAPLYKTNAHVRYFPFFTNIQVNGVSYHPVIALEDSSFRRTGFVACTTNGDALWIDRDGKARVMDFKVRRLD